MNNVSSFENFTSKRPVSLTLDAIANFMRCDQRLESLTKAYRQTGSKHIKMETPLFAVACFFDGGKGKENIKGLTGLSMVDFDHISPSGPLKEEELSALRNKIAGDPPHRDVLHHHQRQRPPHNLPLRAAPEQDRRGGGPHF